MKPSYRTPRRILHNSKIQLFRREERINFNLIWLNCEEAIAITVAIFGYKEVYIFPYIGLQ
jgi:hypothetical protein